MNYVDKKEYYVTGGGVVEELAIFNNVPFPYWEFVNIPGCMNVASEHKAILSSEYKPTTSHSGGSCNYYMVRVESPTTLPEPYTVECNDLIESLGLSFKEANIVKEIFRTANERTHGNGKDGNTPKRAAEKILFFAIRNAITNGVDIEKFTSEINLK